MSNYNQSQLHAYFERIHFSPDRFPPHSLSYLTALLRHQLVHVPFETLELHYSVDRKISLDPEVLFDKTVTRGRGGYCLENNAFFGIILRSLGFNAYGVVCRITTATVGLTDGGWRPMSHMANIVFVEGSKYLIDVGFGADGPTTPLLLQHDNIVDGLRGQDLRLELKTLPQHTDPSQKVWVYFFRCGNDDWKEIYHFSDSEFFLADFHVLNHYNMTIGRFTKLVVAQRFESAKDLGAAHRLSGSVLLSQNRVERRVPGRPASVLEHFSSEVERCAAFSEYFALALTQEEEHAIIGTDSELEPAK
ncbi:N-hydroxyarylamine O-acetyltransferase [Cercospora beticola]|uniref:N-hydroxyarylamine O-acetyltransferase n=1 Tax=Cercospora beticola TaxID=122368 RepID=A0A2G5HFI4_CERBT|nr:N-hydroxyarylamine O-acetyltransferase [Cercospora beticola]PIA90992.1 N-hydroxyarylamine O-acetyltransferase [Cercospora beticola]WPB08281.1 hypothetical protein RHO25_012947 [Cercospora beticola]CAK1367838.1 unnamed protein product [Cercospora beticola]